jgi:hypothetical protein
VPVIVTYFNRAVISSQAFARQFPTLDTPAQEMVVRVWPANGMEHAVPAFFDGAGAKDIDAAIYHLTRPRLRPLKRVAWD